jgi:RNA polymerase sigma-70 factor (ECF subfamily)
VGVLLFIREGLKMTADKDRLKDRVTKLERDRRLVKRMRNGDQSAFREIFDLYHAFLLRFLSRYRELERDDMADIMQQTFIKAFENLDSLKDTRYFGTWFFRIARNEVASLMRTKVTERKYVTKIKGDPITASKEDPFVREQVFNALEKALKEIADPISKKIVDFYYGSVQMTTKEISEKLGIPKGTVTSKLQRLRQRLHCRLAETLANHDLSWLASRYRPIEPDDGSSS